MEHARSHSIVATLSLVLALLGHDAVMATEPHTTVAAHPEVVTESDCSLPESTQPQSAYDFHLDEEAIGNWTPPLTQHPIGLLPHWTIDPDHPPAVKRALLQIYLN